MLTLYARKEPTTDDVLKQYAPEQMAIKRDVVLYRDHDATKLMARYPWHRSKPDKRYRYVTLNCYRWRLHWLPDLKPGT